MRPTPLKALMKMLGRSVTSNALIHGVCIDSRLATKGDLFFALKGKKSDGHAHLEEAAAKGAVAALVEESYKGPSYGLCLVPIVDVKEALQELAIQFLQKQKARVIAITGSIGKTTTKEFAKTLIGSSFRLFASPKSYNSQLTVPLSILSARGDEEILLLEMGMSEPGNLAKLVEIAPPDIALITNIAVQHANQFEEGLEGIAKEKAAIFSHPKTQLGIFPFGCQSADLVASTGSCLKQTFSMHSKQAHFFAERSAGLLTIHEKETYQIPLTLPLKVYDHNFLAALSLARALEIPWPVLRELAPFVRVPPMRFEKVENQGITFINDAYNANPDAMIAALESLPAPKKGGKVIAVLSEMDALGQYSEQGHRQVAQTALKHVDVLLCIGQRCTLFQEEWNKKGKSCELCTSRTALQEHLKKLVKPGDVVLLKGARAYALDHILRDFW